MKELGRPLVAVGGGGYNLTTVPRMWTSACLTLRGIEFDDDLPEDLASQWEMPTFSDLNAPDRGSGKAHADAVVEWLQTNHIPKLSKPG